MKPVSLLTQGPCSASFCQRELGLSMLEVEKSSPRIAFATTVYDQTDVGGGTFVAYLRRAVEAGCLDMVFFSDDMKEARSAFERRVKMPPSISRLPGGWLSRSYFFHNAIAVEHSRRPFDLIWHNNAITSLWDIARPLKVPVVGMINDYYIAESRTPFATRSKYGARRALIRFIWHQFERYCARRVDHLVINSRYMADRIRTAYSLDPQRVLLLYKGVDLEKFEYRPNRSMHRPVRILFVKRDYIRGGLLDLMRAVPTVPHDLELTVVGPSPDEHTHIFAAADRAGITDKVRLSEPATRDEIAAFFAKHDILCIPSRSEALGVAFMEGMASGIPVIGANVGGLPEVLDYGRAGWLAEPGDPQSIAAALVEIIESEGARKRKVEHGRQYVSRFSHDRMVAEVNTIAESIAHRPGVVEECA